MEIVILACLCVYLEPSMAAARGNGLPKFPLMHLSNLKSH